METLLFDSYRVFQKEYKGNFMRRFFKLPVPAIVLFFVMLTSLISAVVSGCINQTMLYLVSIGVEIVAGVVSFFYIENFQLKTIDKRLVTYRIYCADVHTWLSQTGFVVTLQNVQELLERANQQIEIRENSRKEKNAAFRHVGDVLLIPFLLAIFSLWMTGKTELGTLITGAVAILFAVGVLGMIGYFVYSVFSFYRKRELEQWRCFANDLQGVIDTQIEGRMLVDFS